MTSCAMTYVYSLQSKCILLCQMVEGKLTLKIWFMYEKETHEKILLLKFHHGERLTK